MSRSRFGLNLARKLDVPKPLQPQKNPLEDDLKDDLEKVGRDALLPGLGADKARIEGSVGIPLRPN
jgi:hypothetical protein